MILAFMDDAVLLLRRDAAIRSRRIVRREDIISHLMIKATATTKFLLSANLWCSGRRYHPRTNGCGSVDLFDRMDLRMGF